MVQREDAQPGPRALELLLDPAVAATPDVPVVEIGLTRVDRDHRAVVDLKDRVAVAEELLEVDVADVPGVVVARDHDDGRALDPVEVLAREPVLLLEAEDSEVARADNRARLHLVDLRDRPLEQARLEVWIAAMQVRDVRDRVAGASVVRHFAKSRASEAVA